MNCPLWLRETLLNATDSLSVPEALRQKRTPSNATETHRVIIWKCILNKRLVQICIEENRLTLYIVRTHTVGHFICRYLQ